MTTFLLAFIVGAIGIVPFFFSREIKTAFKIAGISSVIYILLGWWIFYSSLPSLAYPFFGWIAGLGTLWLLISSLISIFGIDCDTDKRANISWILPVVTLLIIIIIGFSGCNTFRNKSYSSLIGNLENKNQTHWSQDIQPLDPKHIRLVPSDFALTIARLSLSQDGVSFGSRFSLAEDYITLQKIRGDYWYLIPLDYDRYTVWTKAKNTPGYIRISATDPMVKPEFVMQNLVYTPGAFFHENLQRKLWYKYNNMVLMDYSFEEDDNGNPYWVVTACKPSISYWGLIVKGVILVNPKTGEDKYITNEELASDSNYVWIDRVYPKELVEEYIDYWGSFKEGWWNKVWDKNNLLIPETPTMNYSADGVCVFVTPITSTNEKDQSMTGLIYTDARTGKSIYYTTSEGATEEAIIEVVNNTVSYKKWHASEQIVYENIFGLMSAIVPILSENGKNFMGLAIVETANKRVALGTNAVEALIEYRKLVAQIGGRLTTDAGKDVKEVIARILRIGWDMTDTGKQYYLLLNKKMDYSFIVTSELQSELALTKEGDSVKVTYIETLENPITAMSFKNITLGFKYSPNQVFVDSSMIKNKQVNIEKKDVKDFKEEIKNMDDSIVKKMMDKIKIK